MTIVWHGPYNKPMPTNNTLFHVVFNAANGYMPDMSVFAYSFEISGNRLRSVWFRGENGRVIARVDPRIVNQITQIEGDERTTVFDRNIPAVDVVVAA